MKKILIYIVMIIFLIVSISYAENCVLKKGSIVASTAVDLVLYNFFIDINEKQLLDYMFKKHRLATTIKNIEVKILNIIIKEDISVANIKIKNENVEIWVFYNNIKCNGEENDKTKRKTPKGQEEERGVIEERTKRPAIEI